MTLEPLFKVTPGVSIILLKDQHVFLLRRSPGLSGGGCYTLPGGHVDGNETMRQAGAREVYEEVGVRVNPQDLQFVHVMHHLIPERNRELVIFFFAATTWQGEPYNKEPEKHTEASWFSCTNLPNPLGFNGFNVAEALNWYYTKSFYSELGW